MRFTKLGTLALAALLSGGLAACDGDDTSEPPLAPSNVQVSRSGETGAVITWSAASGAESYRVERSVNLSGTFNLVADNVAATTYTDTISAGNTYQYRVVSRRDGESSAPSNPATLQIGARVANLTGNIRANRLLSKDTLYILSGIVAVDSGFALTIPAGTRLVGDTLARPSALVVRVGGRIEANGTAAEPIVFTSQRPVGQRRKGDWGGVILNGRSLCNFPAPCQGEAGSGQYGGNRLDDNSGTLRYVRIEYAGFEVSQNNELNGLTLNGVGSGTTIDFIQVHNGSDDGIELFGGTVNIKHAIVTGASDDSFDYSTGWQGKGQFWIVQQDPNDADKGFEVDGNETNFTAQPFTNPNIYNVTLVGKGNAGVAAASGAGFHLRRGTMGTIRNAVVLGFKAGIDIDDAVTGANCTAGTLVVANTLVSGGTETYDSDADALEATCSAAPSWAGMRTDAPGLGDPFNRTAPNFQPAAGSAALTGGATPPNDGFFDTSATYLGAVAATGTPWYSGWITVAQN